MFRCRFGAVTAWTILMSMGFAATAAAQATTPAAAAAHDQSPAELARWSFDEPSGEPIQATAGDTTLQIRESVPRVRGVLGNALSLSKTHRLRVRAIATTDQLAEFTIMAWVKPLELGGYREIFRQECAERILFSFQNDGSILSLGLNIGGYVECDAAIRKEQILDGAWHHVAATFDGQLMRVFLDGREIGNQTRRGLVTTNTKTAAFIGSSSGTGEFFQGALDELAIFGHALAPNHFAELHRQGTLRLANRMSEYTHLLTGLYQREATFARTMAGLRSQLAGHDLRNDSEFLGIVLARLQADFAEPFASYVRVTGKSPLEYLTAKDTESLISLVGQYVERMQEYRPVTAEQRSRLTSPKKLHWSEVQHIAKQFAALSQAETQRADSPQWIELLLAAAARTEQRPTVSEAVAPYRTPKTPETTNLSPQAAEAALHRDWLHQADGHPNKKRILNEVTWTRELAARITAHSDSPVDLSRHLASLAELELQVQQLDGELHELYFRVRAIKRAITFHNPLIDFDSVLFVDMPMPAGSEWPHETRHRLGYMAVPGARLMVLKGLPLPRNLQLPGDTRKLGHLRQLMPQAPLHGSFWRPDLSFDGRKVLFCFKPHNEKSFHLYEINLDGSGLVQLTEGPYDDLDPIYLPDGKHVMFSTTRGHTYVRCMPPTNAFVLARCDMDGKNVYLVSRNNEPDYLPSVLDDGRVIYTRWEYTDKPLWRAQGLWTVNPDGSQVNTLWGNQSVWPDLLKDARGIPGSRRVMFTGSAHHNWFSGSVGIIDPQLGYNFPHGLTKVTADVPWPESGNGPVDPAESPEYHASGQYSAYYSPFPLDEQHFLVSANRAGKFVLYLMDVFGNRELLYEGTHHILHALPVRARPLPPTITDRVAWPSRSKRLEPTSGIIFSGDVYQGAPKSLRGKAKYLRVLNIEPKTYTYWHKRPYISTGPVVSAVQSEGVKRILGTVPIEADGSVNFEAPSGVALHFQLLDERFRALQTMRSFTGVMPGETRGCLGCHESHSRTPEYRGSALALGREPSVIDPPPWGEQSISYPRFVRPVLDQYCAECHEGDGEARSVLDLTARPGFKIFEEPYLLLTGRPSWGTAYQPPDSQVPGFGIANMLMVEGYDQRDPAAYRTPAPLTHLSYNSPLVELAASGDHYGVRVDPVSLRKLIAWVDAMCPYRGSEEVRELDDPDFPGIDWLSIRPRVKSAPSIVRPGPVD